MISHVTWPIICAFRFPRGRPANGQRVASLGRSRAPLRTNEYYYAAAGSERNHLYVVIMFAFLFVLSVISAVCLGWTASRTTFVSNGAEWRAGEAAGTWKGDTRNGKPVATNSTRDIDFVPNGNSCLPALSLSLFSMFHIYLFTFVRLRFESRCIGYEIH